MHVLVGMFARLDMVNDGVMDELVVRPTLVPHILEAQRGFSKVIEKS